MITPIKPISYAEALAIRNTYGRDFSFIEAEHLNVKTVIEGRRGEIIASAPAFKYRMTIEAAEAKRRLDEVLDRAWRDSRRSGR